MQTHTETAAPAIVENAYQPTIGSLVKSTLVAAIVGTALTITCVLPAEYAIDPTGIGRILGLTEMGEIKRNSEAKAGKMAHLGVRIQVAQSGAISSDAAPLGGAWFVLAQAPAVSQPATSSKGPEPKTGTLEIVLQPNQKMELKAWMKQDDSYTFTWTASNPINFNFHGEKHNAPASEYTEYKKGIADKDSGSFKAGYDGTHGWSWRNRTKQPITVKATITGTYEKFAEKK